MLIAALRGSGVAQKRSNTLTAAKAKHPHCFSTANDPKILALPGPAGINQPKDTAEKEGT